MSDEKEIPVEKVLESVSAADVGNVEKIVEAPEVIPGQEHPDATVAETASVVEEAPVTTPKEVLEKQNPDFINRHSKRTAS